MMQNLFRVKDKKNMVGFFFLLVVLIVSLCNFFAPKKEMLEMENRKTTPKPMFSLDSLFDGSYGEKWNAYVCDQFILRDELIDFKCFVDQVIFRKKEENQIILGDEKWLFTKQFVGNVEKEKSFEKNINAIKIFSEETTVPVTFMMVPSASFIYSDMLPIGAPMIDENHYFNVAQETLAASLDFIDLREKYKAHKEEYIYYKTDHHWTMQGAHIAYESFLNAHNALPKDWNLEKKIEVPFYGTHYTKSRLWDATSDTLTYYSLDYPLHIYDIKGEAEFGTPRSLSIINEEKLKNYDKYAAYIDGNHGYSVIEGDGSGKILIVKDSYGNSFAPLFVHDYEKIGIVDFRNYAYGLESLIEKEEYDEVLILYSFQSLWGDNKIVFLNKPTMKN